MRPQYRNVIANIPRIRRAGSDIDQRNAAGTGTDQMEGGHLRHTFRSDARNRTFDAGTRGDDVARLDETFIIAVACGHASMAELYKGLRIELVIGEDYEFLEVLGICTRVMVEPVQGIVDARGAKQSKRFGCAGRLL